MPKKPPDGTGRRPSAVWTRRAHTTKKKKKNKTKKKGGEEEAKANKNDVVDQDDGLFRSKKRERRKGVEKSREKADKRLALL